MALSPSVQGELGGLQERIAQFAAYLVRADRSPATVRSYQWGLDDLCAFVESRGIVDWSQITGASGRALLEAWQDRLIAVKMRPRSRSLATTAASA
jgi:site-specific recombinase XerC